MPAEMKSFSYQQTICLSVVEKERRKSTNKRKQRARETNRNT